jgi:hypothetical protein
MPHNTIHVTTSIARLPHDAQPLHTFPNPSQRNIHAKRLHRVLRRPPRKRLTTLLKHYDQLAPFSPKSHTHPNIPIKFC